MADFPVCICPAFSSPVCGIDGVTYNNKCHAKCNKVVEFKCESRCDECDGKCTMSSTVHSYHIGVVVVSFR